MNPIDSICTKVNVAIVQYKNRFPCFRVFLNRTNSRRIYSHVAVWITLLHLLAVTGRGTTIIGIRFNEVVVIVADSRLLELASGKTAAVCKIHARREFTWAVAGLIWDTTGGYNINRTIGRIAAKRDTLRRKVNELDETIPDVIREEAKIMRRTAPKVFERFINSSEILEFLFIGSENGKMTEFFREYKIELVKGKVNVAWTWSRECPGRDCRYPQMTVMGERGAAEAYLVAHPVAYTPSSIESAIRIGTMLVQMEAVASPDVVGLPINTAIIDSHGVQWGPDNIQCKDTNKTQKPSAKYTPKHP